MIHALPGMGANQRMYPYPWTAVDDFVAHDWVPYSGERTLAEVALSMCEAVHIQDGDSLIGSSLGGMVACEITKIRRIPKLYLIGSAVQREEISSLLAVLYPLAKIAPLDWMRFSASKVPGELAQMFAEADASFIKAMCAAIFTWDGLGKSPSSVFRIHGKRDLVIPPPSVADLFIDGGHLISISHARECVAFIKANQSPEPTRFARGSS
jgi:pimeloyl-ACP methyl ester carboxylesterase